MVHQTMFTWFSNGERGQKNRTKIDDDDDKRASMTMNKGEGSSRTPLYGISRGFTKHREVCAETYVDNT